MRAISISLHILVVPLLWQGIYALPNMRHHGSLSSIEIPTQIEEEAIPSNQSTLQQRDDNDGEGKYGYINFWLDPWTVLGAETFGQDYFLQNEQRPKPELFTFWNRNKGKDYENTFYLYSYDPQTVTNFSWWRGKSKEKKKLKVVMPPTKEGEDKMLINVKVRTDGNHECSMHGGKGVVAEWVK